MTVKVTFEQEAIYIYNDNNISRKSKLAELAFLVLDLVWIKNRALKEQRLFDWPK